MLLWIACALLTAAVLAALLRPLWRVTDTNTIEPGAADLAVYRDQLAEVDADLARGVIDCQEAETARREVSRRLLAHSDRVAAAASNPVQRDSRVPALGLAVAALVPASTLALYLTLGSPSLVSRPHAVIAAAPTADTDIANLIQKVETRLRERPDDGQGWDVIAPVYFKLERFNEAANAYARAAAVLGETTNRLAGFAESTVLAANGIVTEDARLAYEKILSKEPGRIEPRFWLALAKEQDGKFADALTSFRALLKDGEPGARWRETVDERIALIEQRMGAQSKSAGTAPARGPTTEDVKAAAGMSATDRDQMINQMVSGLAERLKKDGKDISGWQRLVQAYVVLGRRDDAAKALGEARKNLAGDAPALATLAELAKSLGLGS
jgi:cytochrome c-type biogenesis protein CcmH